jgi:hypothetical protein
MTTTTTINIRLTRKDATWVAVENAGGGKSVKVFEFLEAGRKQGVTQTVSYGDHGYGMRGRPSIKLADQYEFMDRAEAAGLVASY